MYRKYLLVTLLTLTSSSAIVERPRCSTVG